MARSATIRGRKAAQKIVPRKKKRVSAVEKH